MRVIEKPPEEPALVSFEVEVDAASEAEAREKLTGFGPKQLQRPFIDALGIASDDDPALLSRVARLGSRRLLCVVVKVTGSAPRFTATLTAYPGPSH
jgi:hypothetical protein